VATCRWAGGGAFRKPFSKNKNPESKTGKKKKEQFVEPVTFLFFFFFFSKEQVLNLEYFVRQTLTGHARQRSHMPHYNFETET
jgi:hypothetical protein